MNSRRRFSHVLITRPRAEAERLASMLMPLEIEIIVQPAQTFAGRKLDKALASDLKEVQGPILLIFTSTRSVEFGLPLFPAKVLESAQIAAIGPATAKALAAAGRRVGITPSGRYTSEALLETLAKDDWIAAARRSSTPGARHLALIVCAPGGRQALQASLIESGWDARPAWVYDRLADDISAAAVEQICQADQLLSVWTSGKAMESLSQRLPPSAWYAICRGEWLVMSERLQRLARAYGPAAVHLSGGPGNADLAASVRSLVSMSNR